MNKNKRTNNVSLKLNDDEKQRIELFAGERDLSIAEYLRMSGLKHRIKPTVIQYEQSQKDVLEPETLLKSLALIQPYIAENGYMHWHDYKNDEAVINALKYIRNSTFNNK